VRRLLTSVLAGTIVLAACGGGSGGSGGSGSGDSGSGDSVEGVPAPEGIPGVLAYDFDHNHIEGPIDYPLHPPPGGDHNHVWANCGFYDSTVPDENVVHTLEHGAVWIAYSPDLPDAEKQALQERVDSEDYLIATEYPGMDSPLVLSAWNRQLALDSMDDPRFEQFIDTYRLGPTSPEPGASCTGGVG
jgi:uncharacterized protein DUF3105